MPGRNAYETAGLDPTLGAYQPGAGRQTMPAPIGSWMTPPAPQPISLPAHLQINEAANFYGGAPTPQQNAANWLATEGAKQKAEYQSQLYGNNQLDGSWGQRNLADYEAALAKQSQMIGQEMTNADINRINREADAYIKQNYGGGSYYPAQPKPSGFDPDAMMKAFSDLQSSMRKDKEGINGGDIARGVFGGLTKVVNIMGNKKNKPNFAGLLAGGGGAGSYGAGGGSGGGFGGLLGGLRGLL